MPPTALPCESYGRAHLPDLAEGSRSLPLTGIPSRLTAALADRYAIERELGAGGMATVYLAEDLKHRRKVAVKVLRPELAAVLGAERFVQEITTTASLQHPHILPLYDSGRTGGEADGRSDEFLFYVMPYIQGETLRNKLDRETQLGIDEAVRIACEVADALHYAHEQGVIHRDMKPENILLRNGRALVADFGIALAVSAAAGGRMTETGLSLGTPHYMSPEQATAEKDISARSDVYSLGSVLYEMLTGTPPHVGASAQQIIMKIVTEEATPVTQVRKSVPPNVVAATAKALEKLPADRFVSAADFGAALQNPAFSTGSSGGAPVRPSNRLPFRRAAVIPVLAATTILATSLAAWGWLRRPEPTAVARSRFYHATDSTHVLSALCCGPLHAISRDGRRFAYTGATLGRSLIFVREIDDLHARPIPGTRAGTNLFFSPDGEWLGFVDQQWMLHKVSLAGGTPIPIVNLGGEPLGATWTDRNTIVFASRASPDLWSVSADGGEPERLAGPDSAAGQLAFVVPSAVPGADALVFTVWMVSNRVEDARAGLLKLGSPGDVRVVTRGFHPQVTASGHLTLALPGGSVAAQGFDLRSGTVSGPLDYLADGVYVSSFSGWADYAISWSGTLLYRVGGFNPRMATVRSDGSSRDLEVDLDDVRHFDAPRVAPDGRRLGFAASMTGGHRVHVMDLDRGTVSRVTLDGDTEHFDWTDDGDSVVVAQDHAELVVQPANRSGEGRVILSREDLAERFAGPARGLGRVSVAGAWMAFERAQDTTGSDIIVARRDSGATVRPYVATPFRESAPAIAPGGRWLAYVSDETGRDEIYVSAFPTPGGRQTVSREGGTEPVWAPDGRTLYFRNAIGSLVAARVRADGAAFVVDALETLPLGGYELSPDGADYDVAPNGEFVMFRSRSSGSSLVVVLNALAGGLGTSQ
jgi:serine/threonine protein kinase/Tol biopolymer transport system component